MSEFSTTLGAILAGAFVATFLSGIVTMQVFIYYRLYPKDQLSLKATVGLVWVLDGCHALMVCLSNWQYLIDGFGNETVSHGIVWPVCVTIALTAVVTFLVHCFFVHRVYTLSKRKWYIAGPIGVLACLRVVSATSCTTEMARIGTWAGFAAGSGWLFTTGLCISAAIDVAIAASLIYYLKKTRSGPSSMDQLVDTIVLYTVENGALTSIFAIMSLVCWMTMRTNLVFLSLHFAISKLYANSFLATLNARKTLQEKTQLRTTQNDHPHLSAMFPSFYSRRASQVPTLNDRFATSSQLQISVEKTVQYVTDSDDPPAKHDHYLSERDAYGCAIIRGEP